MITGLDHIVILSGPLAGETARYERLGFTVIPGGSHPSWGTENTLIPLGDGTYLELLAIRHGETTTHRLWRHPDGSMRRPGEFSAFALAAADLDRTVAHLRASGIAFSEVQPGARLRPDGQRVEWKLAFPDRQDLPFLIEDVTARATRVPPPGAETMNAAAGLARVSVFSSRPDAARVYAAVLDTFPAVGDGGMDEGIVFPVGSGEIIVRPAGGAAFAEGISAITLRLPERHCAALPLVEMGGERVIAPDAAGGLRIAVLVGELP